MLIKIIEQYLPSIIMIIIGLILGNQDRKRTKAQEESEIRMNVWLKNVGTCLIANNEGTVAIVEAIQHGETNGKLTALAEKIKTSNETFKDFINDIGYSSLAKKR